jgi:hypothetical protein
MASLTNPKLSIKLISGTSKAEIKATVDLGLSQVDRNLIEVLGVKFKVGCAIRGSDSGFNGGDDTLIVFSKKTKTSSGTVTFETEVNRDVLDEDWEGNDEIYARFTLATNSPTFPANVPPKNSSVISGNF